MQYAHRWTIRFSLKLGKLVKEGIGGVCKYPVRARRKKKFYVKLVRLYLRVVHTTPSLHIYAKTVFVNSVVASAAYAENITSQKPFSTSDSIPTYLSRIKKMKIFTLFTQNSLISFTQQYLKLFTFPNRFNKHMYRMEDAALASYQLWNANIRHVPKQLIPI